MPFTNGKLICPVDKGIIHKPYRGINVKAFFTGIRLNNTRIAGDCCPRPLLLV
jgi:hypothetical protein